MKFEPLDSTAQVSEIKDTQGLSVIFKHNTTCPISKSVRGRFEQEADTIPGLSCVYFLDLLAHRDVSDAVAEQFNVPHESPQLLLIRDGKCIYNESMYDISAERTAEAVAWAVVEASAAAVSILKMKNSQKMQDESKGLTKEVKDLLEQIETIRNLLANSNSVPEIRAYCVALENLMVELEQAVKKVSL